MQDEIKELLKRLNIRPTKQEIKEIRNDFLWAADDIYLSVEFMALNLDGCNNNEAEEIKHTENTGREKMFIAEILDSRYAILKTYKI